jgi:hypothetical protein|tara:strand:- start:316 stop:426 length:111 start_codon:yes stop_codon:yes gene_type:complete
VVEVVEVILQEMDVMVDQVVEVVGHLLLLDLVTHLL